MKLSKTMRETIVTRIMDKVYPPTRLDEIANEVRKLIVADPEIQKRKTIAKKYDVYVDKCSTIKFFTRTNGHWSDYRYIDIPFKVAENICCHGVYVLHTAVKRDGVVLQSPEYDKLIEAYEKYEEESKAFKNKVTTLCSACSTTKQLKELLPEAADFIIDDPKKISATNALVPITMVNEVRSVLGAVAPKNEAQTQ